MSACDCVSGFILVPRSCYTAERWPDDAWQDAHGNWWTKCDDCLELEGSGVRDAIAGGVL